MAITDIDASIEILNIVKEVNSALDKLQHYRMSLKNKDITALKAIYVCQSILIIEKFKLCHQNLDLKTKIKELLHILKHLSLND